MKYDEFLSKKHEKFHGTVETTYVKYSKNNKPYHVMRISTDEFTLYTSSWKKEFFIKANDRVNFRIIKKSVTFWNYFSKRFYAPTYWQHVEKSPITFKDKAKNFITSQHETKLAKELFGALFLATPVSKELRSMVQNWGVSHLMAISGFHLGILYASMFFVFKLTYSFFQDRFFPYRDVNVDIGVLLFGILAYYVYLIGFAPSFVRSYVMSLVGFFFYIRYIKIVSFGSLALCVGLLLAFFPHLLFSLGFWFSVMGVFYIFLYLYHFGERFSWFWTAIFLNAWVFLAMQIPVHVWFGYTSVQQFGAIVLSLLFVVFYPLMLVLHLVGFGGVFDGEILKFLSFSYGGEMVNIPLWVGLVYIFFSILSIFNRYLAFFTVLMGVAIFV